MREERKYVLSIAGFDPSGGAGVLADIKTFESNKVYGLAVISGNTIQSDKEFKRVDWVRTETITAQLDVLLERFSVTYIKIGIIESLSVLTALIGYISEKLPNGRIIWDPVLRSSSGFTFHQKPGLTEMKNLLSKVFILTPNSEEAALLGDGTAEENVLELSKYCNIYLKGGHNEKKKGYDTLFLQDGRKFSFRPRLKKVYQKHGSGCVLSAALTAFLAKGDSLQRACLNAKEYTERFLASNETLLGYHK